MNVTLVCVGSEILDGRTLNTNASFVGTCLKKHDLSVSSILTIPDIPNVIARTVRSAVDAGGVVITVGGLGPTTDDLTKETIATELGLELKLDHGVSQTIEERFKRLGRTIPNAARIKQATVMSNSDVIPNDWGIAPGLWHECEDAALCMMPGPPREFEPMFETYVLPMILKMDTGTTTGRTFRILGIGEATVQDRSQRALAGLPVELGYCVVPGATDLHVTVAKNQCELLTDATERLKAEFGPHFASPDESLITRICDALRERHCTWGVAESCTGGMIASDVIDLPGVSDVFAGGVVTYSNELKMKLLGVSADTLEANGAVSEAVATEMVKGLLAAIAVDAGIAVTGIAGPDGGTPEKPAGTVFIATAVGDDVRCTRQCFPYGRRGMRERTAITALRQLWRQLEDIDD
jgi:nicotinamide-nucleotide amidase